MTARRLYQHNPLLILLKDRWHLNTFWICAGVVLLPGSVFLFWWLGWARTVAAWNVGDTLSSLLQTFILFPVIFLIYVLVPGSIAGLQKEKRMNDLE